MAEQKNRTLPKKIKVIVKTNSLLNLFWAEVPKIASYVVN